MTRNKTNRESSEIDSSIFSSIIYDRDSIINQWGKENTGSSHGENENCTRFSHQNKKTQVQLISENYVIFSTTDDSLRFPSGLCTT